MHDAGCKECLCLRAAGLLPPLKVSIGSETSGWVRDVTIRNSTVDGTERCVRIKSARHRGGGVRNATYEHLTGTVDEAVSLTLAYESEEPTNATATPEIHDVVVRHVGVTGTKKGQGYLDCVGLEDSVITGLVFEDVTVDGDLTQNCAYCEGVAIGATPQPCFNPR